VLLLRQLDRQVAAHTQGVLFARAMGNDEPVPDPDEIRDRFEELLQADPAGLPVERTEVLREAFGLTTGG
jgi:hypothetical protein